VPVGGVRCELRGGQGREVVTFERRQGVAIFDGERSSFGDVVLGEKEESAGSKAVVALSEGSFGFLSSIGAPAEYSIADDHIEGIFGEMPAEIFQGVRDVVLGAVLLS